MSAVRTVFDALDRTAAGAPPADNNASDSPPGASSGAAGASSVSSSPGGSTAPSESATAAKRLPKVLGGDVEGLSHTIESRVYNEERHVVDINVALPPGTRVRRKGSAHGVTIHTGYGTAKP